MNDTSGTVPPPVDVLEGQAVYTRPALMVYDVWVIGLSCRWIWRCPSTLMLAAYERNVGAKHLELGVGTGYYLDRAGFGLPLPRITLVDLNPTVLEFAGQRIARYRPERVRADLLEPLPVLAGAYDSAALNFVLHCLPGPWARKGRALDHVADALRPGGRLFGSTILSRGVPVGGLARQLMRVYNGKGVFHNEADDLDGLRAELARRFDDVRVSVHGVVARFEATARPDDRKGPARPDDRKD